MKNNFISFIFFSVLQLAIVTPAFAGISVSPAEFGDLERVKVFAELNGPGVIELSGSTAKSVYDSLKVPATPMNKFSETLQKITNDGTVRCYQTVSPNADNKVVTKTRCSVQFNKK
jgi:hypothetical protein